ncbi:MAG: 3-dehydroquinate synthase [Cellulomonadaceae bacterium]|jgi:3-dehydroquinate synthase|nr:3-dehydroquinate synthase [Cellulomonadaceae bacterium]
MTRLSANPMTGALPAVAGEAARVRVRGETTYDVLIGRGVVGELPDMLGRKVARVFIVYPGPLQQYATQVQDLLDEAGYETWLHAVPDAEAQKKVGVVAEAWSALGRCEFTRTDAVVAVGGGATTDLGGCIAATWQRGVKFVNVSTTLLGMVDAAVGGKTGINTGEGKNLVGSFHSPAGVICDLDMLRTLTRRDIIAGLGEVIKTGFIADPRILDLVDDNADALREWDGARVPDFLWEVLGELVERAIAVKAHVVGEDLTEQGLREILNYGHTFGHAVELVEGFQWRHGEAVAVGMMYEAELARLAGILTADVVEQTRTILASVGLPTTYPAGRWEDLATAMRRDKKTRAHTLRFVVLEGVGQPTRLEGPDADLLTTAYDAVSA